MSAFKILPLREKSAHKPKCQSGICYRVATTEQTSHLVPYQQLPQQLLQQLPQQPTTIIIQNIIQQQPNSSSQYIFYNLPT